MIKKMNLQIDNLCQFLPQDKVQEFSCMKNRELLRETERAVMGETTVAQHDELIKMQKEGNSFEEVRQTFKVFLTFARWILLFNFNRNVKLSKTHWSISSRRMNR